MASMDEGEVESLKNYCKMIGESLGPSVTQKLSSLIEDFDKQRISLSELRNSIPLLFEETSEEYEDDDTDLEEGEIREDRLLLRGPEVEQSESNRLEGLKRGADAEVRVSDERELEKHVTEQIESSVNKTRTSKRLQQVTPSYKRIPEEDQCPVKSKVLNNERRLKEFDMYEANMLMEALKSAAEKAEKVIREEMSVEDLGVKFYRCIGMLYCEHFEEIIETVRQNHKKALPVILRRLKQKVDELTAARETLMPGWKQVLKENAAKQSDSAELSRICEVFDAELSPSEIRALVSLIRDFNKFKIGHAEFSSSVQLLVERKPLPRADPLAVRAKEYPTRHGDLGARVTNEERESEPVERTLEIPRKSVTPNYELIPEEERVAASKDPVLNCLNNTCALTEVNFASEDNKLSRYEQAMATCEDEMFDRDREIGALKSAMDSAERVLDEEMRVEDLGVLFYKCIQKQFRRDMSERVRQDHKQVLPEILTKLKQRLDYLTAVRERKKPRWKKIFQVNTARQRELNTQILKEKAEGKATSLDQILGDKNSKQA